jgi:ubiquitin
MAVLNIEWTNDLPMEKVVTGEVASVEQVKNSKPIFVWVSDGDSAEANLALDDDRVRIASRFFKMVKVAPGASLGSMNRGKETPRFILATADLKTVKTIEGNALKVTDTWAAMKAVFDKQSKKNLDGLVKTLREVLVEFDNIAEELKVLTDKEERKGSDLSAADKKEIAAKRAELDARQKKAETRRDAALAAT